MLLLVRNLLNGVISEAAGRSRCARMAAGLPEEKEKVRGEKRRKGGRRMEAEARRSARICLIEGDPSISRSSGCSQVVVSLYLCFFAYHA